MNPIDVKVGPRMEEELVQLLDSKPFFFRLFVYWLVCWYIPSIPELPRIYRYARL